MGCGNSSTRYTTEVKVNANNFVGENVNKLTDVYTIGKVLGTGAFGEVRLCTTKVGGTRAVKEMNKEMGPEEYKNLMNEMQITRQLDHPNILKIYEFFEDKTRFYLVLELCGGGELFDTIIEEGSVAEKDASILIRQLLASISYCHLNDIIHRDLKPENVLLEEPGKYDNIKLIDFGCAVKWKEGDKPLTTCAGTPYYLAPEVLRGSYGKKCDVWSIGVMAYIVLCGKPPFYGEEDEEIFYQIRNSERRGPSFQDDADSPPLWAGISDNAKEFIQLCLTFDPNKRPSAQQALQHPWIVQAGSQLTKEMSPEVAARALENMQAFNADSKLKQATYAFMSAQIITKAERSEIDTVFRALDKAGTGMLNKDVVREGYKEHFGRLVSEEEIDDMFAKVDTDGSGFIDYSEFVVSAISAKIMTGREKLKAVFQTFDKDNGGTISKSEIRELFSVGQNKKLDPKLVDEIMQEIDENGDGEVSWDEFTNMMLKVTGPTASATPVADP